MDDTDLQSSIKLQQGRLRLSPLDNQELFARDSMRRLEPLSIDGQPGKQERKKNMFGDIGADAGLTTGAVCLISHSPYRILKIAAKGNIEEFERIYNSDHSKLHIRDQRGQGTLHYAASKGRVVVMEFILKHGGDLEARDNKGNSPLHTAVENKQTESIDYLVTNGADTAAHNHKQFTPLILAIDLGLDAILEFMLTLGRVNPEDPGENGATPLHYCTYKDDYKCANVLLSHGAKLSTKCDNGFYPVHTAAYHASVKTVETLLQFSEKSGYTRDEILKLTDREGNNALHASVISGDLQTVRVCLQAGAQVQSQQEEKLTPVHFAASQGALEIIELMFEMSKKDMHKAIDVKDSLGMTPLHKAAIFNHENVVRCLLDHAADINCEDNRHRTPLMTAAAKGGWNTVRYLLQRGAHIHLKDEQSRNFLHLAIKRGGRLHQFGYDIIIQDVKNLLNEKDDLGCTPLHYASKEGYLSAIEDLIGMGAMLNPKNNERQSPFHFAARYGRYNTCLRLLDSEQGPNIINEADNTGLTALHIAAENGHTKILTILMQRGAAIHKDFSGNTALHLAASNGYTQSMRLLLNVHTNLLNFKNKEGDTALHLAACNGHVTAITLLLTIGITMDRNSESLTFFDYILDNRNHEAAMAVVTHERWSEVMGLRSTKYTCTMIGLIQQLPEITIVVLDQCQSYSEHDRKEKDFHITYNFKHLLCPEDADEKKPRNDNTSMSAVNAMVKFGRVDCLSHPVCVNYLQMKWNGCGMWFHFIYLGLYLLFLGLLTNFAISNPTMRHKDITVTSPTQESNQTTTSFLGNEFIEMSVFSKLSVYILLIFSVINCFKEVGQIIQQKWRYFQTQNGMEWALYLTTFIYISPFLAERSVHFQYEAGTLAVFLAWFNLLHCLQRFDFFGIYVVMFLTILSTLLQVLCVFSILIVAFGLAFYMLMSSESSRAYSTPGLSMLRTAMMMLELDYMESFNSPHTDGDSSTLHFDNLTLFMLLLFVLLMPILLMNLLIGLAVGDIESVQRDARLKRLAMQVEHHADLEEKLPKRVLQMVNKEEYKIYPNRGQQLFMSFLLKVTSVSDKDEHQSDPHLPGRSGDKSPVYEELSKQKQRLKEISSTLNKQHDLLRLIVQKMEINAQLEFRDEGETVNESMENLAARRSATTRRNVLRNTVLKQTSVINAFKKHAKKS